MERSDRAGLTGKAISEFGLSSDKGTAMMVTIRITVKIKTENK